MKLKKNEETKVKTWAENEIEIACGRERGNTIDYEWNYEYACYESALKAYKSLCYDSHSGLSTRITKQILDRLIDRKPLTPIEDVPEIWSDVTDCSGLHGEVVSYQCKRMSSLFKYVYADGTIKYRDNGNHYCFSINNPGETYRIIFVQKLMDELFPVTLPYYPGNQMKVACETFLTDKNNCDFDTVGVFYVIKSDGERVDINRFYKETENGFVEIDETEYNERKEFSIYGIVAKRGALFMVNLKHAVQSKGFVEKNINKNGGIKS